MRIHDYNTLLVSAIRKEGLWLMCADLPVPDCTPKAPAIPLPSWEKYSLDTKQCLVTNFGGNHHKFMSLTLRKFTQSK